MPQPRKVPCATPMPSSKVSVVTHTRSAVTQLRCPKVTPASCLSAACRHDKCAHVILHVSLHRKRDSTCIHTAVSFIAGSAKSDQACMLAVHGRCSVCIFLAVLLHHYPAWMLQSTFCQKEGMVTVWALAAHMECLSQKATVATAVNAVPRRAAETAGQIRCYYAHQEHLTGTCMLVIRVNVIS